MRKLDGRAALALAVLAGAGLYVSGQLDAAPVAKGRVLTATAAAGGGMLAASTLARLRWEVAAVIAILILLLLPGGRLLLEGVGIGSGGDGGAWGGPNECTPERHGQVMPDGSICLGTGAMDARRGSVFV